MDRALYERLRKVLDEVLDLSPEERARHLDTTDLTAAERAMLEGLLEDDERTDIFAEDHLGAVGLGLLEKATGVGPEEVPRRIGAYRVLSRLGDGGMGVVYSARADDSDVIVALKVLPACWHRGR